MLWNKSYSSMVTLGVIHYDNTFFILKTWMNEKKMNMIRWMDWQFIMNEIDDVFELRRKIQYKTIKC